MHPWFRRLGGQQRLTSDWIRLCCRRSISVPLSRCRNASMPLQTRLPTLHGRRSGFFASLRHLCVSVQFRYFQSGLNVQGRPLRYLW